MSIFNRCKKTIKDGGVILTNNTSAQKMLILAEKNKYVYSTVPSLVREKDSDGDIDFWSKTVFYISDLHLFHHVLRYLSWDDKNNRSVYENIDSEKDPDAYDKALIGTGNMVIIGGTGFAEFNEEYNADKGFYRHVLNRQQEIEETEKWKKLYTIGLEKARKIRGQLIVLTHNPMQDWMGIDFEGDPNCIYFNGHNHNNFLYHNDDRNVHVYANNQIGHNRKSIKLRKAVLYSKGNPFAGLADGIHEIKSHDYLEFYAYVGERLQGNGIAGRTDITQTEAVI